MTATKSPLTEMTEATQAKLAAGNTEWVQTTADVAIQLLEAVPPAYQILPATSPSAVRLKTHDGRGYPLYYCFRNVDQNVNTAEARICTVTELMKA